MSTLRISAPERPFFAALADVVYGNVFSANRAELIAQLVPGARPEDLSNDPEALARVVTPRLEPFLHAGGLNLPGLSDADRRLLEPAFLYVCYIRAVPQLDALIERQAGKGGEPLPAPFADEVVGDLMRCGFDEERSLRYFALYFQLRRGFYFIRLGLAGECLSMRRLREALWNNIFTHDMRGFEAALWSRMEDFSTLVLGETGTGKGAVAAAIGRSGFIPYDRARRRFAANFTETFIAINLSQYPETLIESELFGHRRGSFTGAVRDKVGYFEAANGGTLFLDEISTLSLGVQSSLLRVLEERTVTPVGDTRTRPIDLRIITASNRDLEKMVDDGEFREDLLYRLNVVKLELPPLRQRIEDIPALVQHFLDKYCKQLNRKVEGITNAAMRAMLSHEWRGNVREVENVIERAVIFADGREITVDDLPFASSVTEASDVGESLKDSMHQFERQHILACLRRHKFDKAETAHHLGIGVSSLYRKLDELDVPKNLGTEGEGEGVGRGA